MSAPNPYAFPNPHFEQNGHVFYQEGMSLRDWFAGQALSAIFPSTEDMNDIPVMASLCYRMADAMLAERSKP